MPALSRLMRAEDTLYGTMTVRETFEFVAALTREANVTPEEEHKRISEVIGVCRNGGSCE